MNNRKCPRCGLVNFAVNDTCRRCAAPLNGPPAVEPTTVEPPARRSIGRRVLWLLGVIVTLIFLWSRSLLLTSEPIDANQQRLVMDAVRLLERSGFTREVVVLRHFANYRATDNWWNLYLGHRDAYAATNFPLGVVTLYPPFFRVAKDDTERAAILFHEAQHLLGAGEIAALETVWREKQRLGWTADAYGATRVWKNTKEWTATGVPALFRCGADLREDCAP
jgi:hypothetical protein